VNSEGIYGTRPYKMFGEGPATDQTGEGKFNENGRKALTAQDVRYTTKGKTLYAFVMGWPGAEAVAPSLTESAVHIRHLELLGHKGRVKWGQDANGLTVSLPAQKPCDYAIVFKIERA
jgi:alpha-L-fucosidase